MSRMSIFSCQLDPLKFNPFQQSVGSGKSGLAPNYYFACLSLNDIGKD
jgi:hypothetical protein